MLFEPLRKISIAFLSSPSVANVYKSLTSQRMQALLRSILARPLKAVLSKQQPSDMAAQFGESVMRMRELISQQGQDGWWGCYTNGLDGLLLIHN
jgi:hypothetical protein